VTACFTWYQWQIKGTCHTGASHVEPVCTSLFFLFFLFLCTSHSKSCHRPSHRLRQRVTNDMGHWHGVWFSCPVSCPLCRLLRRLADVRRVRTLRERKKRGALGTRLTDPVNSRALPSHHAHPISPPLLEPCCAAAMSPRRRLLMQGCANECAHSSSVADGSAEYAEQLLQLLEKPYSHEPAARDHLCTRPAAPEPASLSYHSCAGHRVATVGHLQDWAPPKEGLLVAVGFSPCFTR
jgi:hypothetical protein